MKMPTTYNGGKARDNITDASDQASAAIKNTAGSLAGEFKDLVADIEEFITNTTSMTGEQLEQAKQQLRSRIVAAKQTVGAASDSTIARARRSAEVTNEYVHEQPWAAVGIGLAVGFLSGFVCARRN
jgi:ElaB/YqjD/DUF883 family membrane-anchored ribosome-binding protein